MFHVILLLCLSLSEPSLAAKVSFAKPGCQQKCGNVTIKYPFGIGPNCSIHDGFAVTCNDSFNPPKPFIKNANIEVINISLGYQQLVINNPIMLSGGCSRVGTGSPVDLTDTPFSFSASGNRFISFGCNYFAKLTVESGNVISGCMSICSNSSKSCDGINCCQTPLPYPITSMNASIEKINGNNDNTLCKSMFIAKQEWFTRTVQTAGINAVENMTHVPAILDWRIYKMSNTTTSRNAICSSGNKCVCERGYEGNPYLPAGGCQDIDECADWALNSCFQNCWNTNGSYFCYCDSGYKLERGYYCQKGNHGDSLKLAILGTCIGLGALILLIGGWWLWKLVKRRKEAKLKDRFFKRNGGLLLQQQISSENGNFEATKLFTSKELEKATDNYNMNRVLGQGGQGTVYKGMLTDGRIVAVKKAKILDEGQLDEFINEVVILSQINHRNVVKLLGCCLETEVPMLVYEYIPNGTLFHYIHNQVEEFPLSWDLRLRIAREVAGALSYLHSAASVPIYHRDIKSTNILLDEKYRAKVSDFGTSRSICVDQTHLTTIVKGTFGYLDPEYFQSSQFTEKSDVYSFGVVLVELLTGQKAISSLRSEEWRGLATYFLLKMEKNHLFDILDARVAKEGEKEEIFVMANLARRCLNLNGRQRPTMREVLVELESIRLSKEESHVKQNGVDIEYPIIEVYEGWETNSTSSRTGLL